MSEASQLINLAGSLKSTAAEYARVSNELVAELSFLGYIVSNLQVLWKGKSSLAFMNAWQRAIRDGAYLSEALAQASTAMRTLASVIDSNIGPIEKLALNAPHAHALSPTIMVSIESAANTARDAIATAASAANSTLGELISTVGVCSNGQGPLPPKWTISPQPARIKKNKDGSTTVVVYVEGKGLTKFEIPPPPPGGLPPGGPGCPNDPYWPFGKAGWVLLAALGGALNNTVYAGESWLKGQIPTSVVLSQLSTNFLGSLIAGGAALEILKKQSSYCANNSYALALAQSFIGGAIGGTLVNMVLQPYVLNPIFGAPKPKPKPKTPPPVSLYPPGGPI